MSSESLKIGTDHLVLSPLSRQDQLGSSSGWERFNLSLQEGIFGATDEQLWAVPLIPGLRWAASERSSWKPQSWDHSWPRWRACWSAPSGRFSIPCKCPWPGRTRRGRGVCASCSRCDLGNRNSSFGKTYSWHQSDPIGAKAATHSS